MNDQSSPLIRTPTGRKQWLRTVIAAGRRSKALQISEEMQEKLRLQMSMGIPIDLAKELPMELLKQCLDQGRTVELHARRVLREVQHSKDAVLRRALHFTQTKAAVLDPLLSRRMAAAAVISLVMSKGHAAPAKVDAAQRDEVTGKVPHTQELPFPSMVYGPRVR